MNFQTVSTAQKLPTSNGLIGGYLADGVTPGPLLNRALDYINTQVGAMVAAIKDRNLEGSTAIILSAKHGQSPQTPSALTRIPDGPIIKDLNAAWKLARPSTTQDLVAFSINDDGMLMWINDHSKAATAFAKDFLLDHSGTGNDINGQPKAYTHSGLKKIFAGEEDPVGHSDVESNRVETTQIAPTILRLLGLDPHQLNAVQVEHTEALSLS
jgi:hypothetical protein